MCDLDSVMESGKSQIPADGAIKNTQKNWMSFILILYIYFLVKLSQFAYEKTKKMWWNHENIQPKISNNWNKVMANGI